MKLISLISLLLLSSTLFASDSIDRAIDELMVLSGVEKQFADVGSAIVAGMDQQGGQLPSEVKQQINTLVSQAYDSNTIKSQVRQNLKQALSIKDIKQLFVWLKSDIGKKITHQEELASTPQAMAEFATIAAQLKDNPTRSELLKTLESGIELTKSSVDMAMFTSVAVTTGIISAMPAAQRPPENQIQAILEQMRPQIESAITVQMDDLMLYTYRNINDAELKQYIAFNTSPSGKKYNKAILAGVNSSMNDAALSFGDLLAKQ